MREKNEDEKRSNIFNPKMVREKGNGASRN